MWDVLHSLRALWFLRDRQCTGKLQFILWSQEFAWTGVITVTQCWVRVFLRCMKCAPILSFNKMVQGLTRQRIPSHIYVNMFPNFWSQSAGHHTALIKMCSIIVFGVLWKQQFTSISKSRTWNSWKKKLWKLERTYRKNSQKSHQCSSQETACRN